MMNGALWNMARDSRGRLNDLNVFNGAPLALLLHAYEYKYSVCGFDVRLGIISAAAPKLLSGQGRS